MSARNVTDKPLIKPGTTVWSSASARLELVGSLPEGVHPVDALGAAFKGGGG